MIIWSAGYIRPTAPAPPASLSVLLIQPLGRPSYPTVFLATFRATPASSPSQLPLFGHISGRPSPKIASTPNRRWTVPLLGPSSTSGHDAISSCWGRRHLLLLRAGSRRSAWSKHSRLNPPIWKNLNLSFPSKVPALPFHSQGSRSHHEKLLHERHRTIGHNSSKEAKPVTARQTDAKQTRTITSAPVSPRLRRSPDQLSS